MEIFFQFMVAAILIESVVHALSLVEERKFNWKFITAIVLGLGVALVFALDLFAFLGLEARLPYVGEALTGIVLSRGSNYVADVFRLILTFRKAMPNG